ncbi:MAG: aldose 1-epimerase family protein [Aerococcus sp.]|nr:aldose 1-epimerase family protein [Aerococcus sp.]
MDYLLANDALTINVSTHGAQLESLRRNDQAIEYLYQGFPEFWSWQAPLLFPHVGSYKDGYITVDGTDYHSPRHGFGRHMVYTVETVSATAITFLLTDSKQTHESYPYRFVLRVTYELVGDKLEITYRVTNTDTHPIHFSIGSHPAFNVPLAPNTSWADYQIQFTNHNLKAYHLDSDGLYEPDKTENMTLNTLALDHELFVRDALIYEPEESMTVTLTDGTHGIALDMGDHPLIGIWSPYPTQADFVCLEPWQGLTDPTTATHDLTNKPFSHTLAPHDTFTTHYSIRPF